MTDEEVCNEILVFEVTVKGSCELEEVQKYQCLHGKFSTTFKDKFRKINCRENSVKKLKQLLKKLRKDLRTQ